MNKTTKWLNIVFGVLGLICVIIYFTAQYLGYASETYEVFLPLLFVFYSLQIVVSYIAGNEIGIAIGIYIKAGNYTSLTRLLGILYGLTVFILGISCVVRWGFN